MSLILAYTFDTVSKSEFKVEMLWPLANTHDSYNYNSCKELLKRLAQLNRTKHSIRASFQCRQLPCEFVYFTATNIFYS